MYRPTALHANPAGRDGFYYGSEGSGQTTFDDNLILTMGMPLEPMGTFGYATTVEDGTRTLFGSSAISLAFVGESDHYMVHESTNGNVHIRMQVDIIGDAARIEWLLTNTDTANPHNIGLWTGHWINMLSNEPDATGAQQSGSTGPGVGLFAKEGYVVVPGIKPPFTDIRFERNVNPATFPQWVNFNFGQSTAYGMRIENGSTEATVDLFGQSETEEASEIVLGKHGFLLGADGADARADGRGAAGRGRGVQRAAHERGRWRRGDHPAGGGVWRARPQPRAVPSDRPDAGGPGAAGGDSAARAPAPG